MSSSDVCEQMRADWNARAREDAHYYVAFGRRQQDDNEFLATAADVVRGLERELKRLPQAANHRAWRALEIGCGPGRLMRPLSRHFGEIHGVDVSDEMVALARQKLCDIPHAHVSLTSGADLAAFADASFDFVYSYAVFQHIPSRDVVFRYLAEARRVLKTGGMIRCQINGLPQPGQVFCANGAAGARENACPADTWHGVRISAAEIAAFTRQADLQLLALEGQGTQYMWVTLRKRPEGWSGWIEGHLPEPSARIRRITNPYSSEPVVPCRGRFACASLWVEGLPEDCDLNHLELFAGQARSQAYFIGPPEPDSLQQVNAMLPSSLDPGLVPVQLYWLGKPVTPVATLRLVPPGPVVPRILGVTDGIDLLAGPRVTSRTVKVRVEEVADPREFQATLGGSPVTDLDILCTDPLAPRFEINFRVPGAMGPGVYPLEITIGRRRFPPVAIEVMAGS